MQVIIFAFLCIVWGTTWVAIKITLEGSPPFLGAGLRFIIACILLFLYVNVKNIPIRMNRRNFWMISLSAFLMYVLDYGLIYWGEQYLSAGVTAIFFATFPLFTGIWSTFLFGSDKFYWNKFIGLLLGLAGVTIVFFDQLLITSFQTEVVMGIAAIIFGAACGAMSVVIVKKYLSAVNPAALSFHQMIQGVVFLLLLGIWLENPGDIELNMRVGMAILYLGAIGSALAFALYYWLLQQLSAITLSLIIYITPVVALLVDYLVFGELIQFRALVGMLIIFAGITFVQFERKKLIYYYQRYFRSK